MKLIYAPRDDEAGKREWEFDEDRMLVGEVKLIEKVTGGTLQEFWELLQRGSYSNIVVLFWIMRRRSEPGVALTDFDDIEVNELQIEGDDEAAAEGSDEEAPKDTTTGSDTESS